MAYYFNFFPFNFIFNVESEIKIEETKPKQNCPSLNIFHVDQKELDIKRNSLKKVEHSIKKKTNSNFTHLDHLKTLDKETILNFKKSTIKIHELELSQEEKRKRIEEFLKKFKKQREENERLEKIIANPILARKYKKEIEDYKKNQIVY